VATYSSNDQLGITFIQPLKEALHTDIAYYYYMAKLDKLVSPPPPNSLIDKSKNINSLTHDFLTLLQREYSQTIWTVLRSGDKLTTQTKMLEGLCPLCLTYELDSLDATHIP